VKIKRNKGRNIKERIQGNEKDKFVFRAVRLT
jgi:hypothetical protein